MERDIGLVEVVRAWVESSSARFNKDQVEGRMPPMVDKPEVKSQFVEMGKAHITLEIYAWAVGHFEVHYADEKECAVYPSYLLSNADAALPVLNEEYENVFGLHPIQRRTFTCPICGYDKLPQPAIWDDGNESAVKCPSCGFHFIESTLRDREEWRKKWVRRGMKWSAPGCSPLTDGTRRNRFDESSRWSDLARNAP